MFANCSVFCDVQHVRSLVLGQNVMLRSVQSLVWLLCDQSSLGTYSLMFANCSIFCDVWHVWSSIFGENAMFRKFDVQIFNVWHVQSLVFWCSFQDYYIIIFFNYKIDQHILKEVKIPIFSCWGTIILIVHYGIRTHCCRPLGFRNISRPCDCDRPLYDAQNCNVNAQREILGAWKLISWHSTV